MAKAKSYKLQGREWTVKDLAEELGLSTPRVHGILKEHNEDLDREDLAALFFNNDDLSDDFKDYILRQMAP